MRERVLGSIISVAVAAVAVSAVTYVSINRTSAQAPEGPALKTPWGEPDLQGIWTDETATPLQRSPKYANQEFFTPEQRAELDKARSELQGRDRRVERGTELDVAERARAFKTACVLGYWGRWREARSLVARFKLPGAWRLPYYAPALLCSTPLGAGVGGALRRLSSLR